jgi:hypothetical protein
MKSIDFFGPISQPRWRNLPNFMKNGISTRGSKIFVGAIALTLATGSAFAGILIPINVVPEPTTLAMVALGAGLLVGLQRFRRKLR